MKIKNLIGGAAIVKKMAENVFELLEKAGVDVNAEITIKLNPDMIVKLVNGLKEAVNAIVPDGINTAQAVTILHKVFLGFRDTQEDNQEGDGEDGGL